MEILSRIQTLLNDDSLNCVEQVQSLWSGYGQILRLRSERDNKNVIAKVIQPQSASTHPRGWNTQNSHSRKLKSYQVEMQFYRHYAALTDKHCFVPACIATYCDDENTILIMDDLDKLGFSLRHEQASMEDILDVIDWLAHFHAKFLGHDGEGLWPQGTYWHLETRQDEWDAMPNSELKHSASKLDKALRKAQFQTLLHGDAKLANFCFKPNQDGVAGVDFQYVGRGPGVRDFAYFIGSALDQNGLYKHANTLLSAYIQGIKKAFQTYDKDVDIHRLEQEIRQLYPIACADFCRFLLGWNPDSWKLGDYVYEQAQLGLQTANQLFPSE